MDRMDRMGAVPDLPAPMAITRVLLAVALGVPCLPAPAQVVTDPARTVEQTQVPVFEDGSLETPPLANFRLHLRYRSSGGGDNPAARLFIGDKAVAGLPRAVGDGLVRADLVVEALPGRPAHATFLADGAPPGDPVDLDVASGGTAFVSSPGEAETVLRFDRPFTLAARFRSEGDGTLVSKCAPDGKWAPDAKALFLRGGRLVYDIGWVGAMVGGPKVDDGETHLAVLVQDGDVVTLYLDGKRVAQERGFGAPDVAGHVFKVGRAAPDFAGDLSDGTVENVCFWRRALGGDELASLVSGDLDATNTPDLNWMAEPPVETFDGDGIPGAAVRVLLRPGDGFALESASVQPLGTASHAALIAGWDEGTLAEGAQIYQTLCVTCHGDTEKEGTLPTAVRFHAGEIKNGHDPFRMFQTLTDGYGLMVPQPQYTAAQKYAVIQYIRETFFKPHNPDEYFELTDGYLRSLPLAAAGAEEEAVAPDASGPAYAEMDFGPYLMWTYQAGSGAPLEDANIAFKGIAVRLDPGPGGVSRGRAWAVYEHDTMRLAAATAGDEFVDWRGIAFDGSHGTHTSLASDPIFATRPGPGWSRPGDGSWDDPRLEGRDGRRFGPLPRTWAHYKGIYLHGNHVVLEYTVGGTRVLESPGLIDYGTAPVVTRTLNLAPSPGQLVLALADDDPGLAVAVRGTEGAAVARAGGLVTLTLPPSGEGRRVAVFLARTDAATLEALADASPPADLTTLTRGGGPRLWDAEVTTEIEPGDEGGAFAVDTFGVPDREANPWGSWMRLSGIDFLPGGESAAVCTWMGDVWIVDGIGRAGGELAWQRVASGLFQPLGLKVVGDLIYVSCRDQIAVLEDLDGDREADRLRSFNSDHQVTEHFHEFAMGLQRDAEGSFYYAKSARHALPALVPHHGTLLRVSPDGARTDILATGFRAANGVCLNPDGTMMVTDQEGHWIPKNRINVVTEGGFYGNMLGFTGVTDPSDDAMGQPMCWITNAFDRSPAELLWVPADAGWGSLNGSLLNLSYGYGKIYVVPHETVGGQVQGGMCALPIEAFPTGVMRARFRPGDGQLYGVGMFAWAGNQQQAGGFYRVRRTGGAAHLPTALEARPRQLAITLSEPVDADAARDPDRYSITVWDLERSARYGSDHHNERRLPVAGAAVSDDRRTITLEVPDLAPTRGMEVVCRLRDEDGREVERIIHNTVHRLTPLQGE